jgi:hypothetical protein
MRRFLIPAAIVFALVVLIAATVYGPTIRGQYRFYQLRTLIQTKPAPGQREYRELSRVVDDIRRSGLASQAVPHVLLYCGDRSSHVRIHVWYVLLSLGPEALAAVPHLRTIAADSSLPEAIRFDADGIADLLVSRHE